MISFLGTRHVVLRSAPYRLHFHFSILIRAPTRNRHIRASRKIIQWHFCILCLAVSSFSLSFLRRDRQVVANNPPHCSAAFQPLDRFASLDSGESKDSYVPRDWYILISPADRRYQRHASPRTPLIVEKERKREGDRPRA